MPRTAVEPDQARVAIRALLRFAQALALATSGLGLFGLARLGRQFPAAASSPALLVPFLLPVLALALEAGALVAFSAALLRAFRALPRAPLGLRGRALATLFVCFVAVLALAQALPRGTERPGAFANELIASAFASCSGGGSVPVPLLGLSVRCDEGQRIQGPMPGVPAVQLAMGSLHFSEDLRQARIHSLELSMRRTLSVKLRAGVAHISGLSPWARSARVPAPLRFLALTLAAAVLAASALLSWPGRASGDSSAPRALGVALSALPGLAAAAVVILLDREQAPALAYVGVSIAAACGVGGLALLRARAPKMFNKFEAF